MRYISLMAASFIFLACNRGHNDPHDSNDAKVNWATVKINPQFLSMADSVLSDYYLLKNAFVEADTDKIDSSAKALSTSLASLSDIAEKDSFLPTNVHPVLSSLKLHADSLILHADILKQRRTFSVVSDSLFSFLLDIQYSSKRVYRQVCPMAFNDSESAHWLSQYNWVENPYLGKKHSKYGAGMLHCGETVDSLNYSR